MKVEIFCPITNKITDENIARLNAGFTVVLLLSYFVTSNIVPVVFLLLDFTARAIERPEWSILSKTSKWILKKLHVESKLINAGPKIFAARIGSFFSLITILFFWLKLPSISIALAAVFFVFALLESAFNYCVACRIYPFIYHALQAKDKEK
ncbi:MAG TPA: DUF4395 domain-containing protein [Paludibacteraceae bacterium]|nr:DUF4395 domain-containing protein [Paludibacteraceae bacterium]HOL29531.1 DUF4395 domain-containing protein [Paludibacteraceae bacterium]HPD59535.1 DUF4395 domain-containing protein [Paludibacteraceae bacterium]HPQ13269.1 DUF4395 domain-containing protein [Paludibacteraceae bacterium]HRS24553.1 DUF4395 domain-containing protein [Paludibacteraceae bacterium]